MACIGSRGWERCCRRGLEFRDGPCQSRDVCRVLGQRTSRKEEAGGCAAGGKTSFKCRGVGGRWFPTSSAKMFEGCVGQGRRCRAQEGRIAKSRRAGGQVVSSKFTLHEVLAEWRVETRHSDVIPRDTPSNFTSVVGSDLPSSSSGLAVTGLRTSASTVECPPSSTAHERRQNAFF